MDRDILEILGAARTPAVLVTVIEVKGSAPRHPGSCMLVEAAGSTRGTVGGGRGEAMAIEAGLAAFRDGRSRMVEVEMLGDDPEGKDLICGGVNRMLVEYVGDAAPYAAARGIVGSGRRALLSRDLAALPEGKVGVAAGTDGAALLQAEAAKALASGKSKYLEQAGMFLDPVLPEEKLLVLGGGHVGLALVRAARGLGFAITVGDDRPEFADGDRFGPDVSTRVGAYADIIDAFPFDPATYAVILSRGHLFDLECARAVLKRTFRYAGLIGSNRKTALIRGQLRADGYSGDVIASLRAPIGIGIGAETPEEIAVSILAEMIAVRHEATGGKA